MIAVDTSAILAILLEGDDAERFADALAEDDAPFISAANDAEARIILRFRRGLEAGREFEALLEIAGIRIEPITGDQGRAKIQTYADYSRGIHPAQLNFGDCFAYRLAKSAEVPLLFKGRDFSLTYLAAA